MKILIVEDRQFWIDTIKTCALKAGGGDIEIAKNEIEVMKKIELSTIDIAVVDLNFSDLMQEEEGYEGINLIKRINQENHETNIIVVTGYMHFDPEEFGKKYHVEKMFLKSRFEKNGFTNFLRGMIKKKLGEGDG